MAFEYYAVDLPGKILYPKQFGASVRRITPIEQKYILSLSQKQQRTNRDYIEFLKKLVAFDNPEMTFEQLYWFDVQYLLYKIRFTTYEKHPIKLVFKCDEEGCDEEINVNLNIGDIIPTEASDIEGLVTGIHLENLGDSLIRQKTMGDDLVIDNFLKKHKEITEDDMNMRLLLLDLCLISNGRSLDEMWELANDGTITVEDISKVEDWFAKTIWGVKEEVMVKCPKCGKESSRAYILALEDFFSAI